jgi:hypothetical protein
MILKWNLKEIGWEGVDRIHLAQDRDPVAGSCEHGHEPSSSTKLLTN